MWSLTWTVLCLVISGLHACETGLYGDKCGLNCSELCKPETPSGKPACYNDTGLCKEGCISGPKFDPVICDGASKLLFQYVVFGSTAMSMFVIFIVVGVIFWCHRHQSCVEIKVKAGRRDLYNSVVSTVEDNIYILPKPAEHMDTPKVLEDDYLAPGEYITPMVDHHQQDDYITPNDHEYDLNTGQMVDFKVSQGHWGGVHFNNHDLPPAATTSTTPLMPSNLHNPSTVFEADHPPWAAAPAVPATPSRPATPTRQTTLTRPTRPTTPTLPPVSPKAKPSVPIKPPVRAKIPKSPSSPAPCVKRFIALVNENNEERSENAGVPRLPAFTPQKLIGRHVFLGAAEDHPPAVTWNTWDSSKPTADHRPLEEADLRWNTVGGLPRDHHHARQGREQNVISEHLYEYCT